MHRLALLSRVQKHTWEEYNINHMRFFYDSFFRSSALAEATSVVRIDRRNTCAFVMFERVPQEKVSETTSASQFAVFIYSRYVFPFAKTIERGSVL
jgi:hypothetical protein